MCQIAFLVSEQLSQPAGLRLLGFKRQSLVRDYHQIKHSYFVYPDERSLIGSTAAFIALHHVLLASGKVAICSHTRVDGAKPALVALCPQKELVGSDDLQVRCGRWPQGGAVSIGALQPPRTRSAAQACVRSPQVVARAPLVATGADFWASVDSKWGLPRVCRDAVCPFSYMWLLGRGAGQQHLSHGILQAGQDVWAAPLLRHRFKL